MEPTKDYSLEGLTARIVESSKTINDCINQHGLPKLSFDADGPVVFPVPPTFPAVHMARLALLEATKLLSRLVTGPGDHAIFTSANHHDTSTLRTLYRFNVFETVPLDHEITYADVAKKVGLDEDRIRRIMQYAMTNGFFDEPKPGYVKHSASSAAVARDEKLRAMVGHNCEEVYPAAARYTEWLEQHPVDGQEPWEQGLTLAFGKKQTAFDIFENDPKAGHRFGLAMGSLSRPGGPMDAEFVLQAFDWSSLGNATVVDVGGGRGHISQAIAERFPNPRFIIQDYAKTLAPGEEALPSNLKPRFEFMPHDFFEPEPADLLSSSSRSVNGDSSHGVNGDSSRGINGHSFHESGNGKLVFYLRMILHDWPDKYCIKILKNLIPALEKNGGIVLINESVVPPMGTVNQILERWGKLTDVQMMTVCNSRERTKEEFEKLFKAADERFDLVDVHRTPGSPLSIIEVGFKN